MLSGCDTLRSLTACANRRGTLRGSALILPVSVDTWTSMSGEFRGTRLAKPTSCLQSRCTPNQQRLQHCRCCSNRCCIRTWQHCLSRKPLAHTKTLDSLRAVTVNTCAWSQKLSRTSLPLAASLTDYPNIASSTPPRKGNASCFLIPARVALERTLLIHVSPWPPLASLMANAIPPGAEAPKISSLTCLRHRRYMLQRCHLPEAIEFEGRRAGRRFCGQELGPSPGLRKERIQSSLLITLLICSY